MTQSKVILLSAFAVALAPVISTAATNKWETSAAAGVTLTKGNSDTLLGNVTVNSSRKLPRDEFFLGASGTYGTSEKEVTMPNGTVREETDTTTAMANAFAQYNHLFTERWYGGVRLDLLHDAVSEVKYRATLSPMVGYYAIKNPKTRLSFEVGPSLVHEKVGDETDTYAALRLAERFEHKFSDKARVWQSLEILPQIDRFHNYIINAELGAEAALSGNLSLRGVIQDTYDNIPAEGRKKNDLKVITSLVYKF